MESPSERVVVREWTTVEKVLVGAIASCGIAAFLPWVSAFGISAYGIEGDGQITAAAAAAGLVVFLVRRGRAGLWLYVGQALLGALAGLVGLYHAATTDFAAIGVFLTLLAGLVWVASAVIGFRERRTELLARGPSVGEPSPKDGGESFVS